MEKKKIAVLIPCYNEEKTIVKVIRDMKKYLPDSTIYVYDNNSNDCTYQLALRENCVVREVLKQGKGNVVRKMFFDVDADCYLMIDGDDTYSPKVAREMCDFILNNEADMVIGDRLSTTYYKENKKIVHDFGNRLVCFLIEHLFHEKINDVISGYRAFSYDFVKNMPILSNNFEVETEMTIYGIVNNYVIRSVPIPYKDRIRGSISKINTYGDGFAIINTIINLYKENNPRKYYTFISLLFFIVSVVICFIKISTKLCLLFFVLAVISFIMGIVLDNILVKYKRFLEIHKKNMKK